MNNSELYIDIKVGDMTEEITIQEAESSENSDTGEIELTWSDYKTTRAKLKVNVVSEDEKSGAIRTVESVNFTIYYDSGIDNKMRVVYETYNYDIISVIPLGRRRFMDLICKKREQAQYTS